ncbi:MAG: hypothetical protein K0Q74_1115 [Gammaproteobacteria bacterium]|jgi:intracellular multiplication protein IcmL|nr:hypothetical protein [Gammaproteobacteria bacterium]
MKKYIRLVILLACSNSLPVFAAESFDTQKSTQNVLQDQPKRSESSIVQLNQLDAPVLSNAALLQWASDAAILAHTYDFANYREKFQAASKYFTAEAWREYQDVLKKSKNLETVVNKKLKVSAVATAAPVILDQGAVSGRYKWKVQLPILITYESVNTKITQPAEATMLITRVSASEAPKGIVVESIYMSEPPTR